MVTESISSSISAAQTQGELTMASNVKGNLKVPGLHGLGFAAALLTSLMRVFAGTAVVSEPVMAGGMIQNSEQDVNSSGDVAGRPSEHTADAHPVGIACTSPAKNLSKRPEIHLHDVRNAKVTQATTQLIAITDRAQPTYLGNLAGLELNGNRGRLPEPEPHSASGPAELLQTLPVTNTAIWTELSAAELVPAENSGALSSPLLERVAINPLPPQQASRPIVPEASKFARVEIRSARPKELSVSGSTNPPDGAAALTETAQPRALRVDPLRQDENLVSSHPSPTPTVQSQASDGTGMIQQAAAPSLAWAAGTPPPTGGTPKDNPKGSMFEMPAGFLTGTLTYKSSSTQTEKALLVPPFSEIALDGQKTPQSQTVPSLEPPASLPFLAIGAEPPAAAKSTDVAGIKREVVSANKTAIREETNAGAEVGYRDSKVDRASSTLEGAMQKEGGKNTADHASNSAPDHRQGNSTNSLPETRNGEHRKLELAAPASATQGIAANGPSMPAGKAVSGNENSTDNLAAPIPKGGNPGDTVTSPNGDDQQHPTLIQSAHLVSEASKSDVRIALQGEQMGLVELHAKMTGDQVSASITVEHHDTHALLSADLPALHQLLNEHQLRVREIILFHDSLSSGNSPHDDREPAKHEQALARQTNSSSGTGDEGPAAAIREPEAQSGTNRIFDSRGRLSVRA